MKKRRGDADAALPLWELAAREDGRRGIEAGVELAKHYEHRAKAVERALGIVRALLARPDLTGGQRGELETRLRRLERKGRGEGIPRLR